MQLNGTSITDTKQWTDFNNWINYFENKNDKWDTSLDGIFNFTDSFFLFTPQSIIEFERSKAFIEKWLKATREITIQSDIPFKTVIALSLEFGKNKSINLNDIDMILPADKNRNTILASLFYDLKINHKIPETFLCNINLWLEPEYKLVKHLLTDKPINSFTDIQLSKKEITLFFNLKSYGVFNMFFGSFYNTYIAVCKITKSNLKEEAFMIEFFQDFHTFLSCEHYIENEKKHFKFWNTIYKIVSNWDFSTVSISLREALDYITYRYSNDKHFSLRKRTVTTLSRTIIEWHNTMHYNPITKHKNTKWEGIDFENSKIKYQSKTYYFTQIKTSKRLQKEGLILNHCVFSYINKFEHNFSSIWNMHLENDTSKNDITIEIAHYNVIQKKGLRNRKPTAVETDVIALWTKSFPN